MARRSSGVAGEWKAKVVDTQEHDSKVSSWIQQCGAQKTKLRKDQIQEFATLALKADTTVVCVELSRCLSRSVDSAIQFKALQLVESLNSSSLQHLYTKKRLAAMIAEATNSSDTNIRDRAMRITANLNRTTAPMRSLLPPEPQAQEPPPGLTPQCFSSALEPVIPLASKIQGFGAPKIRRSKPKIIAGMKSRLGLKKKKNEKENFSSNNDQSCVHVGRPAPLSQPTAQFQTAQTYQSNAPAPRPVRISPPRSTTRVTSRACHTVTTPAPVPPHAPVALPSSVAPPPQPTVDAQSKLAAPPAPAAPPVPPPQHHMMVVTNLVGHDPVATIARMHQTYQFNVLPNAYNTDPAQTFGADMIDLGAGSLLSPPILPPKCADDETTAFAFIKNSVAEAQDEGERDSNMEAAQLKSVQQQIEKIKLEQELQEKQRVMKLQETQTRELLLQQQQQLENMQQQWKEQLRQKELQLNQQKQQALQQRQQQAEQQRQQQAEQQRQQRERLHRQQQQAEEELKQKQAEAQQQLSKQAEAQQRQLDIQKLKMKHMQMHKHMPMALPMAPPSLMPAAMQRSSHVDLPSPTTPIKSNLPPSCIYHDLHTSPAIAVPAQIIHTAHPHAEATPTSSCADGANSKPTVVAECVPVMSPGQMSDQIKTQLLSDQVQQNIALKKQMDQMKAQLDMQQMQMQMQMQLFQSSLFQSR